MRESILNRIRSIGLMPVVAKVAVEDSEKLAKALVDGGIPNAEITFRMEGADRVIARMRSAYPEMLVGAGTVTSVELAKRAQAAGAQFLVSPGLNPAVVSYCQAEGLEIIPGVATPSEIEQAMAMGLRTLKFFPAEQSGGLPAIQAVCGPYKGVGFLPTGGVNLNNLAEYLAFDRVVACGGTYMLGKHAETGEWDRITALCRKSVQTMLGLRLAHVGVNAPDPDAARRAAADFGSLLLLDTAKEGAGSVFVDRAIEVMKTPYLGRCGHIGFYTASVDRAVDYFRAMGASFREETAKRDEAGRLKAIYFDAEIMGFAVHLVRG